MKEAKAYAKVNIFLKITGHKDGYHTLISRFVKAPSLFDTIKFIPCRCDTFTLEGCEGVPLQSNSIYKAYTILNDVTGDLDILDFFYSHKVVIDKNIPLQSGLGGGSSDAATFIKMVNDVCNLKLDINTMAEIGSRVGADVPFFIYGYDSANVSGFGEVIEAFDEKLPQLEIYTPDIKCDTSKVYREFRLHYLKDIEPEHYKKWLEIDSVTLLNEVNDRAKLNDLYLPALDVCPRLESEAPKDEGWFFSGSGSSFFRLKE